MNILTVVGARPQFIKAAVLSREIARHTDIKEEILHTGQHFDENMSQIFFDELGIPSPTYNLGCNSGSHGRMVSEMLIGIEDVLMEKKPDLVIVYGDTNSTLAASLAASKLYIDVGHVEAGIRSFNMKMPEEINRVLTDRVSKYLFTPTEAGVQNLRNEGYKSGVYNVGDVMYDSFLYYSKRFSSDIGHDACLVTCHRPVNTDTSEDLGRIVTMIMRIAEDMQVVFPLHPRVRNNLEKFDLLDRLEQNNDIVLLPPVPYSQMVGLLHNCKLVLTDSGGLQKEAFFASKPCLTLRNDTEWSETVEHGANHLIGSSIERLESALMTLKTRAFSLPSGCSDLYGNGESARKILNAINGLNP